MPADDHLAVEMKPARRGVARARRVGGAQRKPVDIGAVERRHVDRRGHVVREHAVERHRERDRLAGKRHEIDPACEARMRLLGRNDFEELLLARGAADRSNEIAFGRLRFETCGHGQGLITTSLASGYPSLSGVIKTHPLACASADSGT